MVLNDTVMEDTTEWYNPEFSSSAFYSVDQAETDAFDNTTLDPSHVIHLIRQLLPDIPSETGGTDTSCRKGLVNGLETKEEGIPSGEEEEEEPDADDHPTGLQDPSSRISDPSLSQAGETKETNDASKNVQDRKGKEIAHSESQDKLVDILSKDGGPGEEDYLVGVDTEEKTFGQEQREDPREEAGCVLWDLAASKSHADFLVENHILEVLLTILRIPQTHRIREICLGILGNLACHIGPERAMISSPELLQTVIQQLYVDDSPSLTEACRLLSAGLHSEVAATWVDALKAEDTVERIMWIARNTMNSHLLEKSTELLLAMVDSQTDAATVLLPVLWKLGLAELLIDLLSCELSTITDGTSTRGDAVLDIVLQIAEALSISDDHATQLAANQKLFSLACQVIRLSSRDEIGPAGITAAVLVANLLSEEAGLIHEVSCDAVLSERLFSLLPSAGDDPGARNALWSILNRVCKFLGSTEVEGPNPAQGIVRVFAEGSGPLVEDLDAHREEDIREEQQRALAGYSAAAITSRGVQAKLSTASSMLAIMEQWVVMDDSNPNQHPVTQQFVQDACERLRCNIATVKQRCATDLEQAKAEENGTRHLGWQKEEFS